MRRRSSIWPGVILAAGLALATPSFIQDAEARASFDSPYSLVQTYNAALRLLRVDLGLKILERDQEAGYLLFEYRSTEGGNRAVPGSLELIGAGRGVKVVIQIPSMPRYHEQVLSDQLARKLREEYGEPPTGSDRVRPDGGAGGSPAGDSNN
jgi:hypothetical protein